MRRSALLPALLLVCTAGAGASRLAPPSTELTYTVRTGPVQPAYQSQYTITVRDGAGRIEWRWLAPESTRAADFAILPRALEALRATLRAQGAATTPWRHAFSRRIGGGSTTLAGSLDGRAFQIPNRVDPAQSEAAGRIFAAVDALVPDSVLARVKAR